MQKAGKSGRTRGLVDMSQRPEPFVYKPPRAGDELEYDVLLGDGQVMVVRQHVYRGYVVDFALTQLAGIPVGGPVSRDGAQVFRIDCCHGCVHSHQYFRSGRDQERVVIEELTNRDTAWETIDRLFTECQDRLLAEWEAHYRRWDG